MDAVSTGIKIDIGKSKSHQPFSPPREGEHMWVVVAAWRVTDPTKERFELDTENLLTLEGPACMVCEQLYTPRLAHRRCKGEPSD